MSEGDATWTLGILILLPILIVATLVFLIAGIVWVVSKWDLDTFDRVPGWGMIILAVVILGCTALGFYPYKAEYHQYVTKVGTVKSIKSRLLGSSDSFQQKFVAEFTDGRKLGCEDTRCALVKPGDTLIMACKRQWQYAGTDGYDCKFLDSRRK